MELFLEIVRVVEWVGVGREGPSKDRYHGLSLAKSYTL